MSLEHLRQAPFFLDHDALKWIKTTANALTLPQKIAQLFVLGLHDNNPQTIDTTLALQPGGFTRFFSPDPHYELALMDQMKQGMAIPPLISADLEGSRMSLPFGTQVPNPLAVAAINDLQATQDIAQIMADEAIAIGVNWSFTPVLDINAAFRSAIVATRGFGSDVETIRAHALTMLRVFQDNGIAATVKHWPGEGYDDRDQHLLTTCNPLSPADWEDTFGTLYRSAIEANVLSVMSAHISLPQFVRSIAPDAGIEAYRPASINPLINIELLRNRLGFNGLIVSDASEMAGLTAWCRKEQAKVEIIKNGCDVILFSNNMAEEVAIIETAVTSGDITQERLNDALTRVLALKASLGLHKEKDKNIDALKQQKQDSVKYQSATATNQLDNFGTANNRAIAKAVTARAPTLVKDTQALFPISLTKHQRVLIVSSGVVSPIHFEPIELALPTLLRNEGFSVTMYTGEAPIDTTLYDLVLYVLAEETLLTRGRIFMDWAKLTGNFIHAMQRVWHDVPTAIISFGYPYYLYDAPRAPAYINAYCTMDDMQSAVVDCMLGRHSWNHHNPVDPFCALEDARY